MSNRYTANLFINEESVISRAGNDLNKLLAKILCMLDGENSYTKGQIQDNITGEIVHRCIKTSDD